MANSLSSHTHTRTPSSTVAAAPIVGTHLARRLMIGTLMIGIVGLTGCGTTTGSRAGSAGLFGAAAGAAIGSLSANAGAGALIGLGAGALGGFLYDQHQRGNID